MSAVFTSSDVQGSAKHDAMPGAHAAFRDDRIAGIVADYLSPDLGPAATSCWNRLFAEEVRSLPVLQQSLEKQLEGHACVPVDIRSRDDRHFLSPNENCTAHIKRHVGRMGFGILVSTGTQRSMFDLLLSPEEKCTGLVIRDTDPRVKAYVDFLIILLRISETMEEFNELSEHISFQAQDADQRIDARVALIRSRINASHDISPQMKTYYLTHLNDFMEMYYPLSQGKMHFPSHYFNPRENDAVAYNKNPELFAKLQRYAREGNIVATLGSIDDLDFLDHRKIAFIDTSNIWMFAVLNMRRPEGSHPRVMWTMMLGCDSPTTHLSYLHQNVEDNATEEGKYARYAQLDDEQMTEQVTYQEPLNMLQEDSPLLDAPSVAFMGRCMQESQS